ncbi:MAG: hypothetical protein FWF68_11010 [Spirochaetes bacterium]|nr:hypothetical protein [Spirochaetota bacterium]
MKKILMYTTAFILIFCIKNTNLFSQTEENWAEIDSYDELEGEWEGNAVSVIKGIFQNKEFESVLNISMIFSYKKGEAFVASFVRTDFTYLLTDFENMDGMKEKGYTKENIWEMLKDALENDFFTFNNYSLFYENSALAVEYFASDSSGKFLINDNKDTLLLIYYEPSFILGIGDLGFTEMIFRRISFTPSLEKAYYKYKPMALPVADNKKIIYSALK